MSLVLNGANNCLKITGIASGPYPVTVAGWFKATAISGSAGTVAGWGDPVDGTKWVGYDVVDTLAARAIYRFSNVDSTPVTGAGGLVLSQWMSYVSTAISATDKRVWLAGVPATNNVDNGIWPSSMTVFSIGSRPLGGTPASLFNGKLSAFSIHNFAANDNFAKAHAAGQLPSSLPGCANFFNLKTDKADSVGVWALADFGVPTYDAVDEPPVIYTPDTLKLTVLTHSPFTGSLMNASAIAGKMVVNGVDATSVYVVLANKAVGEYTASVPLPVIAPNSYAEMFITSTVDGVSRGRTVWSNRKAYAGSVLG